MLDNIEEMMEEFEDFGVITVSDGCQIEIDGRCPHGIVSPILAAGLV